MSVSRNTENSEGSPSPTSRNEEPEFCYLQDEMPNNMGLVQYTETHHNQNPILYRPVPSFPYPGGIIACQSVVLYHHGTMGNANNLTPYRPQWPPQANSMFMCCGYYFPLPCRNQHTGNLVANDCFQNLHHSGSGYFPGQTVAGSLGSRGDTSYKSSVVDNWDCGDGNIRRPNFAHNIPYHFSPGRNLQDGGHSNTRPLGYFMFPNLVPNMPHHYAPRQNLTWQGNSQIPYVYPPWCSPHPARGPVSFGKTGFPKQDQRKLPRTGPRNNSATRVVKEHPQETPISADSWDEVNELQHRFNSAVRISPAQSCEDYPTVIAARSFEAERESGFDSFDEGTESFGQNCDICNINLGYEPLDRRSINLPDVAVLPCGHAFHSHCLQLTGTDQKSGDPQCPVCADNQS